MKAPLIVAIINILIVECAGEEVGLPVSRVLRTLDIETNDIQFSGEPLLLVDDEHIPLYSFNRLLHLPEQNDKISIVHLIICESQGRKIGLMVDRLSRQREAFIKSLPSSLNQLPGVSGATIKGMVALCLLSIRMPSSLMKQTHLSQKRRNDDLHKAD